ncbi:hypothetical protein V8F20_000537 [Naviculisporaceae sp. PSN 640]
MGSAARENASPKRPETRSRVSVFTAASCGVPAPVVISLLLRGTREQTLASWLSPVCSKVLCDVVFGDQEVQTASSTTHDAKSPRHRLATPARLENTGQDDAIL